jgi:transposase
MHRTRPHVVSDVPGEPGLALLRAMRAGDRDPRPWARLRQARCHHDAATIAKARHGPWREEHLCAWAQALARDDRSPATIVAGERPSAASRATFAEGQERDALPPGSRPRKRPQMDVRGSRPRSTGVDLTASAGRDEPTALPRSSAIGLDMGRWPTVTPFTSWLGLGPHPRVSGGQV